MMLLMMLTTKKNDVYLLHDCLFDQAAFDFHFGALFVSRERKRERETEFTDCSHISCCPRRARRGASKRRIKGAQARSPPYCRLSARRRS